MKGSFLIGLVLLGGGTSFAAQGTLPGDFLYPVKTQVNERVRGAFAFQSESEARLQVALLEERLREATELAARGELEGNTAVAVRTQIEAQTQKAIAASSNSSVDTQAEVRLALTESLETYGTQLAQMNSDIGMGILADVGTELGTQLAIRTQNEDSFAETEENPESRTMSMSANEMGMSADEGASSVSLMAGKLASIEVLIEDLSLRIKNLEMTLNEAAEIKIEIQAKLLKELEVAKEFLAEAKANMEVANETEARTDLDAGFESIRVLESDLSLLGNLIIDEETGSVIGIEVGGQGGVESEGGASLEGDMIDLKGESNIDLGI